MKPGRLVAVALLAGSLAGGCSSSHDDEVERVAPAPVSVLRLQTLRPEIREIHESIVGTGTIGAAQTSNIGVVTPGIVERVFVKVGDQVKKGQPLFRTRKNDYEISVELARAELTAAQARAEQARLDYERAKDLLGKNFISQAQLDTAGNSQKVANAETGVAKARLGSGGSHARGDTGGPAVVREAQGGVGGARRRGHESASLVWPMGPEAVTHQGGSAQAPT